MFREHLRKIDNRQWWLWSSTVLVLILLTVAVASFAFPAILKEDSTSSFYLNQAVRALVGIVLLFSVYLVYQQTLLIRMRNQIADQITSLAKVENLTAEVYKLAALDQLTGLYNRRSGEQRLAEEISRATRYDRPLTLVMLDLDGLKQINDESGHAAGDARPESLRRTDSESHSRVRPGRAPRRRRIHGASAGVQAGGSETRAGPTEGLEVTYQGEKSLAAFPAAGPTTSRARPTGIAEPSRLALYTDKRAGKNATASRLSQAIRAASPERLSSPNSNGVHIVQLHNQRRAAIEGAFVSYQ